MTVSMGRITARLAEPNELIPADMVELINRNVRPPEPVSAEDVHIRSMYIVSDRVNSFGGRFPEEEHQRLAELLVDSPVMVGHRKDKLPVGRNFHAVRTDRDGCPWVRSYFYWLRSAESSADLAENIDAGIYKECSVAFTFSLPECSICGKDIRLCQHQPLEEYSRNGHREKCHFNYRQIERVLETSLVYRGAVPETSMSKELDTVDREPRTIISLKELEPSRRYLIVPRYDSIEVVVGAKDGKLVFAQPDGTALGDKAGYACQPADFKPEHQIRGLLVGYRGKDRCPATQTRSFIERQTGPVSRLILNILPHQGIDRIAERGDRSGLDVRLIPYREASFGDVNRKALEIMTREGVELWSVDDSPAEAARLVYRPVLSENGSRSTLRLAVDESSGQACLTLQPQDKASPASFVLPHLDIDGLAAGRKFTAWPVKRQAGDFPSKQHQGSANILTSFSKVADAMVFEAGGILEGRFVLRPMKLRGRRGFLLGRAGSVSSSHKRIAEGQRKPAMEAS